MQDNAPIAEYIVISSIPMVNATVWEENRHVVLRRPLDALKIKNSRTFTATELVDVQAAADVLTHDIMTIVRMTRSATWP